MILIKFYVFIPYFTSGSDWRMAINKIGTMGVSLKKASLGNQKAKKHELPPEALNNVDDLLAVCRLLPGQVIVIGMHQ